MTGEEFENCLKYNFEALGYKADTTAKSHDYGADLILRGARKKIVVQVKRYSGKVGIKSVQEVIGAMAYYKAQKGYVVTNNYFTKSAKELAARSNVELWDRNTIIETFHIK